MTPFKIIINGSKPQNVVLAYNDQYVRYIQRLEYFIEANNQIPSIKIDAVGFGLAPLRQDQMPTDDSLIIDHKEHLTTVSFGNIILGVIQKLHIIVDVNFQDIFVEITYPDESVFLAFNNEKILEKLQNISWIHVRHGKLAA